MPVESGADQTVVVVVSVTVSDCVVRSSVRVSVACAAVLSTDCVDADSSCNCVCVCCVVLVLTDLQLVAHRAVSSMRTIIDFVHSACKAVDSPAQGCDFFLDGFINVLFEDL